MRWGWRVRSLRDSVTWREAARLTAVERMPAVSQVSTGPVGGLGKMQARQAVGTQVPEAGPGAPAFWVGLLPAWWVRLGRMFMVAA